MVTVKLAKLYVQGARYDEWGSYQDPSAELFEFIPAEDVTYDEYQELKQHVDHWNCNNYHDKMVLVSVVESEERKLMANSHKEFLEQERAKQEKQRKAKEKTEAEKAAKALEAKRRKLEKLKQELGEVT